MKKEINLTLATTGCSSVEMVNRFVALSHKKIECSRVLKNFPNSMTQRARYFICEYEQFIINTWEKNVRKNIFRVQWLSNRIQFSNQVEVWAVIITFFKYLLNTFRVLAIYFYIGFSNIRIGVEGRFVMNMLVSTYVITHEKIIFV